MKILETSTMEDFFSKKVGMLAVMIPAENMLSRRLKEFLVLVCMFNYEGGNISVLSDLTDYVAKKNFLKQRKDVSTYKTKLSYKRWISVRPGELLLPSPLDIIKVSGGYSVPNRAGGRTTIKKLGYETRIIFTGDNK